MVSRFKELTELAVIATAVRSTRNDTGRKRPSASSSRSSS